MEKINFGKVAGFVSPPSERENRAETSGQFGSRGWEIRETRT